MHIYGICCRLQAIGRTIRNEQYGLAANFIGRRLVRISIWIMVLLPENFRNSTPVSHQDNTSIWPRAFHSKSYQIHYPIILPQPHINLRHFTLQSQKNLLRLIAFAGISNTLTFQGPNQRLHYQGSDIRRLMLVMSRNRRQIFRYSDSTKHKSR